MPFSGVIRLTEYAIFHFARLYCTANGYLCLRNSAVIITKVTPNKKNNWYRNYWVLLRRRYELDLKSTLIFQLCTGSKKVTGQKIKWVIKGLYFTKVCLGESWRFKRNVGQFSKRHFIRLLFYSEVEFSFYWFLNGLYNDTPTGLPEIRLEHSGRIWAFHWLSNTVLLLCLTKISLIKSN